VTSFTLLLYPGLLTRPPLVFRQRLSGEGFRGFPQFDSVAHNKSLS
jgi:hypothetical protein